MGDVERIREMPDPWTLADDARAENVHWVYTNTYDGDHGERAYWECSCGHSGSCDADRVDVVSDRHIPDGDRRVDTNRPLL